MLILLVDWLGKYFEKYLLSFAFITLYYLPFLSSWSRWGTFFFNIFSYTSHFYWIRQELNEDNILFSKCHFTKDGNSDDKSNDETSKECVCLCLGFQWLFSKWLRWCEGQTGENHSLILKTNATSSEECREMAHLSQSEGGLWAPDQ